MAKTSDPHAATVKAWQTRARNAGSGGVVQQRGDWTGLLRSWGEGDQMEAGALKRARNPLTPEGRLLTRALMSLPAYSGTLYRGMSLSSTELKKLTAGSDFVVKKHSSASKELFVAEMFASSDDAGRTAVVLTVENGKGRDYSKTPLGREFQQQEVILMAGTKLRISKVTKHSDWIEVTATQVN
jgi:hypothetical protein